MREKEREGGEGERSELDITCMSLLWIFFFLSFSTLSGLQLFLLQLSDKLKVTNALDMILSHALAYPAMEKPTIVCTNTS